MGNRAVFRKLLDRVKPGDMIIFDEVSRMSRNADEGYHLYTELMEQGVSLVFLKERHIDTEEFRRRTKNHIARVSSSSAKMDAPINGILDLVEDFERENLKDNIKMAFEQAEQERLFLVQRVTEGKARSERHRGRPQGSTNRSSVKADFIRKIIREQSKSFDGRFSDVKIMREYLPGVARNTYYKYKRELMAEADMRNVICSED